MGGSARSLRVWLVEHNDPFAQAPQDEAATVRDGLRERLLGWIRRVLRHANARNVPAGYRAVVEVN
jgi:hypothetical protein